MKRSSDKVMRNFCSEWPQPKVLRKVQPKQISRTTSTGSIVSIVKEPPQRGIRCPMLSEVSLPGNLQDFVRVVCKSEKTAVNESMKCLEKKGRRSLSRDKLQKEDKNAAVRRREPRRVRPKKSSELSLSSSFSEIVETMDFDITSNSIEGSRWQKSNEFHAQVFSCFAQPDYMLDASHRRTEWYRETDKERRKREKKERKAVQRLQKKTAKMKKSCEKRKRKLAKNQEKYASHCVIENCDFGKDYWRKYPPVQPVQQPQATVETHKPMPGDPYRSSFYRKQEYPLIRQPYVNDRYSGQNFFEDRKFRQEKEIDEYSFRTRSSAESLTEPRRRQRGRTKSVLSAERPSFERNTLREFFKSFGWLYPRLGEMCAEYQDRKNTEHDERVIKDARRRGRGRGGGRKRRRRRSSEEYLADRFFDDEKDDRRRRSSASSAGSSVSESEHSQRNVPHNHDPDHVENCDCVRLYLQNQVEKKLMALRNVQISSTESVVTNSSKSDRPKRKGRKPKNADHKRKEHLNHEEHGPQAEVHKNKDFEYRKREEIVPKSEHYDRNDSRTYEQRPSAPEHYDRKDSRTHEQRPSAPEHYDRKDSRTQEQRPSAPEHCDRKDSRTQEQRPSAPEHYDRKDSRTQEQRPSAPEHHERKDSRTRKQRPPASEHRNKTSAKVGKHKTKDHPTRYKRKVSHQVEETDSCQFCGTTPCRIENKRDNGKGEETSGSTQQDEVASLRGGVPHPRKEQRKPYYRQPQENLPIFSYLCQLWKNKNRHPHPSRAGGRVCSSRRTSVINSADNERHRCKNKPVYSRCDLRERNIGTRPWLLETRRASPEICIFREDCPEPKRIGASPSPRMTDHPPTHAHCFLINDNCDNFMTRTDLLCFPEGTQLQRRCGQRRPTQEGNCAEQEHRRRDQAIECHFMRENQEVTDKTTETEDLRSVSSEKINRKNLKARLASLHCLWKNLRKCTLQKTMFGREVGRCIRRSLSGLDTYDYWWSDTWPRSRRQRECRRRCMEKCR